MKANPWWLYVTTGVTSAIAVGLSTLPMPASLFSLPVFALAIWQIQQLLSRSLAHHDRIVDRENNGLQEKAAQILKLASDQDARPRRLMQDLWERTVWLAKNFKELWPGGNKSQERVDGYMKNLQDYDELLTSESINLPKTIRDQAQRIYQSIHEYKIGKDMRWDPPHDPESSLEGGKMMSSGAKGLNKAFGELQQAIRDEYGVE